MCSASVFSMVGTAFNVMGQQSAYDAKVSEDKSNYEVLKVKEADAYRSGNIAEEKHNKETKKLIGSQQVAMGSSGLDNKSGSFSKISSDTLKTSSIDSQTIRRNALMQAWGYNTQANTLRNKMKYEANSQWYKEGGTFLGGVGSAGMSA
jgi:hypothetical protein